MIAYSANIYANKNLKKNVYIGRKFYGIDLHYVKNS